jgi:hypothetical protein
MSPAIFRKHRTLWQSRFVTEYTIFSLALKVGKWWYYCTPHEERQMVIRVVFIGVEIHEILKYRYFHTLNKTPHIL